MFADFLFVLKPKLLQMMVEVFVLQNAPFAVVHRSKKGMFFIGDYFRADGSEFFDEFHQGCFFFFKFWRTIYFKLWRRGQVFFEFVAFEKTALGHLSEKKTNQASLKDEFSIGNI